MNILDDLNEFFYREGGGFKRETVFYVYIEFKWNKVKLFGTNFLSLNTRARLQRKREKESICWQLKPV